MNTKIVFEALSEIDCRYVEEALCYKRAKIPSWTKWGAIAACLAITAVTACSLLFNHLNQQGAAPPNHPNGLIADDPRGSTPPTTAEFHISMGNIYLNDITDSLDGARIWYDPELYEYVEWDKEAFMRYYGKDLTPFYIPDGLAAATGNGTATVVADRDGNIVMDTVQFSFYHEYYDDGSPKLTEAVAACRGFSITASKIGLINDCIYLLPENEIKTSDIAGVAVTFGYRSMPYGPYDPQTHEPSGYYDMYVAEFKNDGIEYQVISDQIRLEELVKVVSSIIYEAEVFIDHA